MNYIIGIDLDNTIIGYDNLIYKIAVERGLIKRDIRKSKKFMRDSIREIENGEIKWQEVQAAVYGSRMNEAELVDGVYLFFELCCKNKIKVYIISHKTEYSNYDKTNTHLRITALKWLEMHKFFKKDGLSLSKNDVYFESTRKEKIFRIRQLLCTHFIDDLEETFNDDSFPKNVKKILYDPHKEHPHMQGVLIVRKWDDINEYFFKSKDRSMLERI